MKNNIMFGKDGKARISKKTTGLIERDFSQGACIVCHAASYQNSC